MQSFKENEIGPNRGEKENDEIKKKKRQSFFVFQRTKKARFSEGLR